MRKKLKDFSVDYMQVLDESGKADEKIGDDLAKKMYELMILSRTFDEKALKLQRQGRIGTYASVRGQEAAQIGSALATSADDWIFTAFRENGVYIAKGMDMHMIYQYWGGDERGDRVPENLHISTVAIPVSTQIPHATGVGWAMRLRKAKAATLVYFGDGATSRGDFHEALNMAGVFRANTVFFCQNNQYAISLPFEKQTASDTVAQKAVAYGMPGMRVDGNDVFGVYLAVKEAMERARGGGPTLIEALTYRVENHTTSDDSKRYRSEEEVEKWKKKDPIERLRKYMASKGIWTREYGDRVRADAEEKVKQEVEKYESLPKEDPADMFKYTFAEMPWFLKEQLRELEGRKGGENGKD